MRVLITGSRGQLGTTLLKTKPIWVEAIAISRKDVDLADEKLLAALIKAQTPDVLVNTAAYTNVEQAEHEEEMAFAVNANAVRVMAEAVKETGGKLVHISTDYIFDGEADCAYHPNDPPAPINAYGRSKLAGENYVESADLLVRTSWLYTAGHPNFVCSMIRLMKERKDLKVVSDQIGCPTWADGLAKAIWQLIGVKAKGTFHYCDDGSTNRFEFAVAIAEESLKLGLICEPPTLSPVSTSEYHSTAQRPAMSLLDCGTTWALLGKRSASWQSNLRRMLIEEKKLMA